MIKKFILVVISLICFCSLAGFVACNGDKEIAPATKYYTVTWKNYDGTVLETDTKVEYGTMPSYDGENPVKPEDDNNTYEFNGWDKEVVVVSGNVEYVAVFNSVPKTKYYTVTWKNYDGTVLETDTNVEHGTMPSYDGENPVKPEDDNNTYEFNGWDKEVVVVSGNVEYVAVFNSVPKQSQQGGNGDLNTGEWDPI